MASLAGILAAYAAGEPRCPLIPMGAITGKPDEQTVRETLEAYKSVGIDQYLIYPRSGLEYEYMGEEWLRMCEWFCKHAKRLDMKIWLYDEYNWPSGSCKGRVPAENPEFESRQYAVYKKPDGTFGWKVAHSPGWVDNYSFKAMERFIELTHKQYERRLGPYLGSTVVGIFTDEPSHPTPVKFDGKPALTFRLFDGLEAEYQAATGRAFRGDVEAYIADTARDEVWAVYCDVLGRRFRKAYFDPIRAWCDRVGLLATGHMIAENSTADSAKFNGNPLHALKGLTLPGIDEIGTRSQQDSMEWITFAVAQHAAGRCGNGGLVELFALGPGDMSHATQRQMIWLSALHKIDRYVLAIAPLDMRGNVEKNGYFNPLTRAQPWFPAFRLLGDEARVAARYAAKPVRCDVAVRYPQTEAAKWSIKNKPHFWLNGALRRFSQRQITYDLYEENEPCDKPFVFAFTGTTFKEEKSGRVFEKLDDAVAFMREKRPPDVWVETSGGQPAEDLLLRHYQDGGVVALDLSAKPRAGLRLMRRGGEPVPFELPARGVYVYQVGTSPRDVRRFGEASLPLEAAANSPSVKKTACMDFSLALNKANTLRLAFGSNGVARLKVGQPLDGLRLAVRCWPEACALKLDGTPVQADQPCASLVQGFNELCRQTAPFRLEAGEHEVTLASDVKDSIYFFPVAWLTGPFAVEDRVVKPVPREAGAVALWRLGLADYAGSVTYTAQTEVPNADGGLGLLLDTGGLYTAVSLDGRSLGERAWDPFEWEVPAGFKGKRVELTVTVWTSAAPLFGDVNALGSIWSKKFWVPPAAAKAEVGLLAPPQWLKAE